MDSRGLGRDLSLQKIDELSGRENGNTSCEAEQMLVPGNECCSLLLRQGHEVVVTRVGRSNSRRVAWVLGTTGRAHKPLEDAMGFLRRDPLAELWIREGPLQFREKIARHDELELALLPGA